MTERGGNGVVAGGGVSVAVGVFDAVGEGVGEFVIEGDGVSVSDGVAEWVGISVCVGVGVSVGSVVTLGLGVAVGVSSKLKDASNRRGGIEVPWVLFSESAQEVETLNVVVIRITAVSVMV